VVATPVVIDTDAGVDDAVALWWALTDPRVDVRAITVVHGNVDLDRAVANVCVILAAIGRTDVPVGVGAGSAVGPVPLLPRASFVHGEDGLGDCGLVPDLAPAAVPGSLGVVLTTADDIYERFADDAVLVTLGPLSTVADSFARNPALASRFARLVCMAGAFASPGNAYPVAEANVIHDPTGAQRVLTAAWRRPPLLVGLDVTQEATLTAVEVALVAEHRNAAATFCDGPLKTYARFAGTFCDPGEFTCHDLLATMAAVIDDIVTGPELPVAVQTEHGPAWGMTVADFRQPFFARVGKTQESPEGFVDCEVALEVNLPLWRREVHVLFGG
jgi:inosine-uridine nucleoside N-ribohydrolase